MPNTVQTRVAVRALALAICLWAAPARAQVPDSAARALEDSVAEAYLDATARELVGVARA
ncbi:MAG: hypothetical protein GWO00_22335, partial [Gemmatimonadetes bacterium]|nr:hypothetical protein [Gemmatimonadota bacterium]NIW66676.1 hypothetical protein [Gemmatimonadota bacterium]